MWGFLEETEVERAERRMLGRVLVAPGSLFLECFPPFFSLYVSPLFFLCGLSFVEKVFRFWQVKGLV